MDIRYVEPRDHAQIKYIYDEFFHDMEFVDFYKNFHCAFVVEDEDGKIIAVGGLRPIVEGLVLTDKDASVRERKEALLRIFEGIKYAAEKLNQPEIHVFAYDPSYITHLVSRMGFKCVEQNKVLTYNVSKTNGQKEGT